MPLFRYLIFVGVVFSFLELQRKLWATNLTPNKIIHIHFLFSYFLMDQFLSAAEGQRLEITLVVLVLVGFLFGLCPINSHHHAPPIFYYLIISLFLFVALFFNSLFFINIYLPSYFPQLIYPYLPMST